MFGILFWLIIIIFIVWLARVSKSPKAEVIDPNSLNFRKGYLAGYIDCKNGLEFAVNHVAEGQSDESPLESVDQPDQSMPLSVSQSDEIIEEPEPVLSTRAKAKRDLQNINMALYAASFLLVAAAALFVGATSSFSESVRFLGVWAITIAFYVTGLVLHDKVKKLRPAAVAFVGTSLALLPVTGIAMYGLVWQDAPWCWFITSLIGLVAFIFAAIRLENQVVSYLAIAFGISMTVSGMSVMDAGMIWYHVSLIAFGSIMTYLAHFKLRNIPVCFSKPIYQSSGWIVPLTIIASIFSVGSLSIRDYWIISLVGAFYYGAVAVSIREGRDNAIFVVRTLLSLAFALMAYDLSNNSWTAVAIALSAIGIMQIFVSAIQMPKHVVGDNYNETWLWIGYVLQLLATLFTGQDLNWASIVTFQLLILLAVSVGFAYYLRRAILSVSGTVALAALPIIWGQNVVVPPLENQWISIIFLALAAVVLTIRLMPNLIRRAPSIHPYLLFNLGIFLAESLFFAIDISYGWGIMIWSVVTLILYIVMCIERLPGLSLVANIPILFMTIKYISPQVDNYWLAVIFLALAAITLIIRTIINKTAINRSYIVANFALFLAEALFFTINIDIAWIFSIWLIGSLLTYILIFLEEQPMAVIVGNLLTVVTSFWFVELVGIDLGWRLSVVSWIIFPLFYGAYWLTTYLDKKQHALYFWWSAFAIGCMFSLIRLFSINDSIGFASGIGIVIVAVQLFIDAWQKRQYEFISASVMLATAGIQRMIGIMAPDMNILVYTHWWALVFAGLSYLYYSIGKKSDAKSFAYIALSVMTFFTGLCALGMMNINDGMPYQMLFIIEHAAVILIGLAMSRKLFTIWGAVCVLLAVLWMIKDFTYLLLALVAVALIIAAIYALFRQSKNAK